MKRLDNLNKFYSLISELGQRFGEFRLEDCPTGSRAWDWASHGVYFFFENGENRENGATKRVVRVGTHAISSTSRTILWNRLNQHRGNSDLGGNHRGSVFRKRVGYAYLNRENRLAEFPDWGRGNTAPRELRLREQSIECEVSKIIRAMPFVILPIKGLDNTARQNRACIEKGAINLLTNYERNPQLDASSSNWLGLHDVHLKHEQYEPYRDVRLSGLWNSDYVCEPYNETRVTEFLERFKSLISNA